MHDRFPRPAGALGAIVYAPDRQPEALMSRFAAQLTERGFAVGGLLQETRMGKDGHKCAMDVVELDSGRRLPITQELGREARGCSLDPSALAEASGAVRRAIDNDVDLLFINKFSKSEKAGGGMIAEMQQAITHGVPLLTAVSGTFIQDWTEFTGGMGQILMPTEDALWRWWGPERLYDDLILGVQDAPALNVLIGLNWTLVQGPHGVGLAHTPERADRPRGSRPGAWTGRSLRELATLARSWDPFEAAIGIAAINAHYNRHNLVAESDNGLDVLDCAPDRLAVIGAFPKLAERLPGARIIDHHPGPGQFPAEAAQWLLPEAEGVIITASALVNRSLPSLLRQCGQTPVALVGPSAPLTPRLLSYGLTAVSGLVTTDVDGLTRMVAEGGNAKDLKEFGRQATIRRG